MNLPEPDAIQIALTLGSLAVAWVSIRKVVVPAGQKFRRGWNKIVGLFQAIAGRDPIVDKASGKELAPAVPPLGERLETINDTMQKLVTVIESNHQAHTRIDGVVARVDGHDQAIAAILAGTLDKASIRNESAALFDMVAKRDSAVIDPQENP